MVGNSNLENLGEDWSDREWVQRVLAHEEQFELKEDGKRWEFLSFPAQQNGYYIVAQSDYVTQIVNINYVFILFCRYHSGGGDNYPDDDAGFPPYFQAL